MTENPKIAELNDDSFEKALKKKTKKYRKGLIARIIIFCSMIIGVSIYPVFPACQVQGLELEGNYLLSKRDILRVVDTDERTPVIFLNEKKFVESLMDYPVIESASIKWKPAHMVVTIDEVAAMINYKGEKYLSNGSTIKELEAENEGFIYNFQASELPEFIGDIFGHFNVERKSLFLNNLKTIERDILTTVKYIDYRGDGDSSVLTEGFVCFYFASESGVYNRICVQENCLNFFLNSERLSTIIEMLELEPHAKVVNDMTKTDISYRSITCYSGKKTIKGITYENPCIVETD